MERNWNDKEYANLRALDAELALTVGGWTIQMEEHWNTYHGYMAQDWYVRNRENHTHCITPHQDDAMRAMFSYLPHYTTSVDAALTLVPSGVNYEIQKLDSGYLQCKLFVKYRGVIGLGYSHLDNGKSQGERMAYVICEAILDMHKRNARKSS